MGAQPRKLMPLDPPTARQSNVAFAAFFKKKNIPVLKFGLGNKIIFAKAINKISKLPNETFEYEQDHL